MSGQRIIGLTGGIATGKTTVANFLHDRYGIPILDADLLARSLLNSERLGQIRAEFGEEVFRDTGELNRRKLGEIIFNDPLRRKWLENLLHPPIRTELIMGAKQHYPHPVMMVIPLLFEANMTDLVTEIWVVTCSQDAQLTRLQQRDNLSHEAALLRISAHLPLSEKVKRADVILNSDQPLSQLWEQATKAFQNSR